MFLESLISVYENLLKMDKMPRYGWERAGISYVIDLNSDGKVNQVIDVRSISEGSKSKKPIPTFYLVPARAKRSRNTAANFLADNTSYMLGLDAAKDPVLNADHFNACKKLHLNLLKNIDSPVANGIRRFYEVYDPSKTDMFGEDADILLNEVGNVMFSVDGELAVEDKEIRPVWEEYFRSYLDEKVARLHPQFTGIRKGSSMGAAFVSFNMHSAEGYGLEQGDIAPWSGYQAFAYGAAFDYLLHDGYSRYFGDDLLLFYAENGEEIYQKIMNAALNGQYEQLPKEEYIKIAESICQGKEYGDVKPDEIIHFAIVEGNAGRLILRLHVYDSLANILSHIEAYRERSIYDTKEGTESLSLYALFRSVNPAKASPPKEPRLDSALLCPVMEAILKDIPYPEILANNLVLRIRRDKAVTRMQRAVINDYLIRKGVISMQQSKAYQAGRLFGLCCNIQEEAIAGTMIVRSRYYPLVSVSPKAGMNQVYKVTNNFLTKSMDNKQKREFFAKTLSALSAEAGELPEHLTIPEQAEFAAGFYDQLTLKYKSNMNGENENE